MVMLTPAGAPASRQLPATSFRDWFFRAFRTVVLRPLRLAPPAVQQEFMSAAAAMTDSELNFKWVWMCVCVCVY